MQSPNLDSGPVSRPSGSQSASAGDVIGDRYHLEREAVRTEAGIVFDATDLVLSTRVAVEVASSIIEPRARRKWTRDAMMAQRLEGEHVLRVIDAGALPNGVPFMVREVATKTLADEVATKGALPLSEAVAYTLEACEGVAEGHALGVAHGDLRLDNVHVAVGTDGPVLKVSWTSAAKAEAAAKEDVARDIAGLGALLRVLATGRLDIQADGAATLPSELAHTVARALAEDPQGSFNNVSELAHALSPFAPPGHTSARKVALLLSRVGIVGAGMPRERVTDPPRISLAPVSRNNPGSSDRASLTDDWFGRASRTSLVGQLAPARSKRGTAFAFVSIALVGLVLAGTWLLFQSGKLPRWSGAAPPDEVGTTQVTNADPNAAAPAAAAPVPEETVAESQKVTAEEEAKAKAADDAARARAADEAAKAAAKSTAVGALPDAPGASKPANVTPAYTAPAYTAPTLTNNVAPSYTAPTPKVEPVETAPATTTSPAPADTAPTPNPYDPSTSAPSTMTPAPTTPAPTATPDADPTVGF